MVIIFKPTLFKKVTWTQHSEIKMRQYGLSKQKVLGILRKPERKEKGIVPGTLAAMKSNKVFFKERQVDLSGAWKPKKAPGEIWLMYKDTKEYRRIISAWRYPGISKPGESIPIPDDIRMELLNEKNK
jgi:hypothetical protein